ncbi:hypothetical protein TNCV_3300221 [Trichonephila clavipes]|nr:hypothetical protein TNCV_3300221 [Trichonephila clavipes]
MVKIQELWFELLDHPPHSPEKKRRVLFGQVTGMGASLKKCVELHDRHVSEAVVTRIGTAVAWGPCIIGTADKALAKSLTKANGNYWRYYMK